MGKKGQGEDRWNVLRCRHEHTTGERGPTHAHVAATGSEGLGAGGSHPDGVPLQKHILPMILNEKEGALRSTYIGGTVIRFLEDNFVFDIRKEKFPSKEEISAVPILN